ncbi:MAG: SDR family NAD(P)-dependent oxidoreductase [Halomonadaceae bacterium]|nr:MAG: SDR family NAD(P)-dependent oxidoreductase [Halomonadaceae bacterium]
MSKLPLKIWLTGATSGIGLAVLELLVAQGHHVIATGRNSERLEQLAEKYRGQIIPLAGDTTNPDDCARMSEALASQGPLDWAILNAGTCEYMDVSQFDPELVARVMNTNVVGTARSVASALPMLRASRELGRTPMLALVSSSAWWFPFTRAEAYGASKAALTYFGQSLRADLAGEGIVVSVVSPGFVKTPLTDLNDFDMPFLISAEEAARRIVTGLHKERREIQFPKRFTLTLKLLRLLPQRLTDALAASMARSQSKDDPA